MSPRRILAIMRKSLNPRNPYIFFALLGPFLYAGIFQLILGIWQAKPEIAVYPAGGTAVISELEGNQAVGVVEAGSAEEVYSLVEDQKVDIGAVFPQDLERRLASGERVSMEIYVNGESLAKSRAIALASITDILRGMSPESPEISFEQVTLGEEKPLTLMEMFLPFFVIIIIVLGAFLLPASFIVSEKEKKTLTALLVTPARPSEILTAFGMAGMTVSLVMGMIVLLLTVGITQPALLMLIFVLGSLLGAEWGFLLGLLSKDQATLMTYIKVVNILIIAPALFVIFPDWPQWIARVFPAYYIANPIFRISIYGDGWSQVYPQLLALCGFVALFSVPMFLFSGRLERG